MTQNLNKLLARRNGLAASLEASRAAFCAFEKLQIEEIARADAELSAALRAEPEDTLTGDAVSLAKRVIAEYHGDYGMTVGLKEDAESLLGRLEAEGTK